MDLARSDAIYRERFGDASDFVFAITGNVDLVSLRPLVERYIGGLPGAPGVPESAGDDGERPASVAHKDLLTMGTEPRATVELRFAGDLPWSPDSRTQLGGMADGLQLKLRDAFREDEAGTYQIAVRGRATKVPWHGYQLTVRFDCDPARREALTERVLAVLDGTRTTPLDDALVAKVREARIRRYETDNRTNGCWLREIFNVYLNGDPEDVAATYPARVAALTPESVRSMGVVGRRWLIEKMGSSAIIGGACCSSRCGRGRG